MQPPKSNYYPSIPVEGDAPTSEDSEFPVHLVHVGSWTKNPTENTFRNLFNTFLENYGQSIGSRTTQESFDSSQLSKDHDAVSFVVRTASIDPDSAILSKLDLCTSKPAGPLQEHPLLIQVYFAQKDQDISLFEGTIDPGSKIDNHFFELKPA
ncbi:MAG: hypothetical protein R2827_12250, partial [Bdellovibrionales bacterium]